VYEGAESWKRAVARGPGPASRFGDSEAPRFPADASARAEGEGDALVLHPARPSDAAAPAYSFPRGDAPWASPASNTGTRSGHDARVLPGREELARGLDLVRHRGTAPHAADLRFAASEAERFHDDRFDVDGPAGLARRMGDVLVLHHHDALEGSWSDSPSDPDRAAHLRKREAVLARARARKREIRAATSALIDSAHAAPA